MTIEISIALPFPRVISPDAPRAHVRSLAWMREQGLVNERTARYFAAMRMGEFAARWWPRARGEDLDLLAELVCWLSLHDDEADSKDGMVAVNARQTCRDLVELVDGVVPSRAVGPIATAWADLWRRFESGMSASWRARNAASWRSYFLSKVHELDREHLHADVDAYVAHRFQANAMQIFLGVGERVHRMELADHITEHPLAQEVLYESAFLAHVINDVVSVEREHARGEVQNAVLVRARTQACSLEEAVERTCRDVNQHVARYVEVERALLAWAASCCDDHEREAVESWTANMRSIARGTLDLADSDRYTAEGAVIAETAGYGAQA